MDVWLMLLFANLLLLILVLLAAVLASRARGRHFNSAGTAKDIKKIKEQIL